MIRRILEPILLGSLANICVNFIFNMKSPDMLLHEFIVAIALCIPVTEVNRLIDKYLDKKFSWHESAGKRLAYHLSLFLLVLIISINGLGHLYMYLTDTGYYELHELILINLVTIILGIILTGTNWILVMVENSRQREMKLAKSTYQLIELEKLKSNKSSTLEVRQGTRKVYVNIMDLRLILVDKGMLVLFDQLNSRYYSDNSLQFVQNQLPDDLFFTITRNAIVHKTLVLSTTSSSFGKIDIEIKEIPGVKTNYTISRLKASTFRKWMNSNS